MRAAIHFLVKRRPALGAAILLFLLSPSAPAAFKYLQVGMQAPPVEGVDLVTGEKISADRSGEEGILVITFWATWSKRSIEILADLKEMAEKYEALPFRVIAINVDSQHVSEMTRAAVRDKVVELGLPFPVIIDDGLEIFYRFGVIAVPSTALIDGSGVLLYDPSGYSYAIRDRLVDSTEVFLGIRERAVEKTILVGYEPDPTANRYYHLALQMLNQRLYERALANLDSAIESDSLFSAPHNLRGQIFLDLARGDEALVEFETAVRLDTLSVAALAGWGRALYRAGDLEGARGKLEAALAVDEWYTPALLDLARCLAAEERADEALAKLETAAELAPGDPMVYYRAGEVHAAAGRETEALDQYRHALELLFPAP